EGISLHVLALFVAAFAVSLLFLASFSSAPITGNQVDGSSWDGAFEEEWRSEEVEIVEGRGFFKKAWDWAIGGEDISLTGDEGVLASGEKDSSEDFGDFDLEGVEEDRPVFVEG